MRPVTRLSLVLAASLGLLSVACEPQEPEGTGGGDASLEGGSADGSPIACTADAKLCPDGSSVGRDPANNCEFKPCPADIACTEDAKLCPDGTSVARDPANDCQFPACPDAGACTADVKQCPDGSYVSRDPENGCQFGPCPGECINPETGAPDTEVQCFTDPCSVTTCAAHPDAQCTANYCGGCHALFTDDAGENVSCELLACTADAKQCPDGSWVSRDGANGCAWEPCPGEK